MYGSLATEPVDAMIPSDELPVRTLDDMVRDFRIHVINLIASDRSTYPNNEDGFFAARDDFIRSMEQPEDGDDPNLHTLYNDVQDCFISYQDRFVTAFIAAFAGADDL